TSTGARVKSVETVKDAAQTTVVTVVYSADNAVITTVVDKGVAHKQVLDYDGKEVLDGDEVLQSLSASGKLKAGFEHSFLTVDSDSQAIVRESWKVIGESTQLLLDGTKVEGLKIKVVKNGSSATVIVDDEGDVLFMDASSGIGLEATKKIPNPFKSEPVVIETVMKSNLAVKDDQSLTELEITFDWKHDDDAEDIPQIVDANAYHDVARLDDGFAVKMKSQKLEKDFELAYPLTEVPDDIKVYLKATAICQSDDEVLAEVAAKLLKGQTDARKLADAISTFVDKRLGNASGTSGSASAKQAYDEKLGDCTEHSVLFVALARAAGLPARNIGGIVYVYDGYNKRGIFGYHAWSEVWLGKWVPVDATVGEVGTSARYIMFSIDEPGNNVGEGRIGRCMRQKLRPEIIGFKKSTGKEWRKKDAPTIEYVSGGK
ncbi:MAG: transglutaminase family protein, partial [Planctomycetota bacterium]